MPVHRELTVVIVLLALGGTVWSGYVAYRRHASRRLTQLGVVTVVALALQALTGIVLAAGGGRPQDPLHFLYGPATIVALPAAMAAARGREARAAAVILGAGWLVTLALGLRAAGSGGLT